MGWESSGVVGFDLGPLLQGQTRIVKQWFTGFGELSFRWIQICIGLRCVGLVLYVVVTYIVTVLVQFLKII